MSEPDLALLNIYEVESDGGSHHLVCFLDAVLEEIEPPEDFSGSVDIDPEEDARRGAAGYGEDDDRRQSASKLEGLDLFE